MSEKPTKNYLTIKNTVSGIVFLTILTVLSGWVEVRFSPTYFSNWKMPLILAIISILIGLVICPIFLSAFSKKNHLLKSSLKGGLITITILLVSNILQGLFHKNSFMPGMLFFLVVIEIALLYIFFKLKKN